jgi:hypothetical protein
MSQKIIGRQRSLHSHKCKLNGCMYTFLTISILIGYMRRDLADSIAPLPLNAPPARCGSTSHMHSSLAEDLSLQQGQHCLHRALRPLKQTHGACRGGGLCWAAKSHSWP